MNHGAATIYISLKLNFSIRPHSAKGFSVLHLLLRPAGLVDDAVGVVNDIAQFSASDRTTFSISYFSVCTDKINLAFVKWKIVELEIFIDLHPNATDSVP